MYILRTIRRYSKMILEVENLRCILVYRSISQLVGIWYFWNANLIQDFKISGYTKKKSGKGSISQGLFHNISHSYTKYFNFLKIYRNAFGDFPFYPIIPLDFIRNINTLLWADWRIRIGSREKVTINKRFSNNENLCKQFQIFL